MKSAGKKIYSKPGLRIVGTWATIWWGVSCLYILLWFWLARHYYVQFTTNSTHNGFFQAWKSALSSEYHRSTQLKILLLVIVVVWILGAIAWLHALRINKISYKVALKDLFLTIRK